MKFAKFALLLLALTPCALPAADDPSAYAQAVSAYVTGASNELSAFKRGLQESLKNAKPEEKAKYEAASSKLSDCEKILARLKEAGPSSFDSIKAEYEKARADLVAKLHS